MPAPLLKRGNLFPIEIFIPHKIGNLYFLSFSQFVRQVEKISEISAELCINFWRVVS